MTTTKRQLAKRLRATREKVGLTQAEVGEMLGLHRPTISEIEAGRRSVDSEELLEFSRLYGVSVSELLTPAGERDRPVGHEPTNLELEQMVRVIVERFDPERIILFGSYARGTAGPDSDVDLLVVMAVRGSRRRKAAEIGAALHRFRVPKDIVVTTPAEFEWRKEVSGTIERPADREGRGLHARR